MQRKSQDDAPLKEMKEHNARKPNIVARLFYYFFPGWTADDRSSKPNLFRSLINWWSSTRLFSSKSKHDDTALDHEPLIQQLSIDTTKSDSEFSMLVPDNTAKQPTTHQAPSIWNFFGWAKNSTKKSSLSSSKYRDYLSPKDINETTPLMVDSYLPPKNIQKEALYQSQRITSESISSTDMPMNTKRSGITIITSQTEVPAGAQSGPSLTPVALETIAQRHVIILKKHDQKEVTIEIKEHINVNKKLISDLTKLPRELDTAWMLVDATRAYFKSAAPANSPKNCGTRDYANGANADGTEVEVDPNEFKMASDHDLYNYWKRLIRKEIKDNGGIFTQQSLAAALQRRFKGVNSTFIQQFSTHLLKTYLNGTEQLAMSHDNNHLPNDIFIRTAAHMVDTYLQKTKTTHVPITISWDPHYTEAIILYCQMNNYTFSNNSKWNVTISAEKQAAFNQLYKEQFATFEQKNIKAEIKTNTGLDVQDLSPQGMTIHKVDVAKPEEYHHVGLYAKRGSSYYDGIKVLLEHIDPNKIKKPVHSSLTTKANILYNNYIKAVSSITNQKMGKSLIEQLLADFVLLLKTHTTLENPKKELDIAERVAVWKKGRNTLTTVIKNENETLIQVELPRRQLTTTQKNEYLSILTPTPPDWFNSLPNWQQNYMTKLIADGVAQNKDMSTIINTLPTSLRNVSGLANYSDHILLIKKNDKCVINSKRCRSAIVAPIDIEKNEALYNKLAFQHYAQVIAGSLRDHALSLPHTNDVINLPLLVQTSIQKGWSPRIKSVFKGAGDNEHKMLIAKNGAIDKIKTAIKNNDTVTLKEIGLGEQKDGAFIIHANGKEHKIKLSLITTNHTLTAVAKHLMSNKKDNDSNMVEILKFTIPLLKQKLDLTDGSKIIKLLNQLESIWNTHDTKHIIGELKCLIGEIVPTDRPSPQPSLLAKSAPGEGDINGENKEKRDAHLLLAAMQDYLELQALSRADCNRELFLTSLEHLLIEQVGGLTHLTCKSGKDRTGAALMHTDAMLVYFHRYEKPARYNDTGEERRLFCETFADLYYSRHQQENAQENSPGSFGLKGSMGIFPSDICAAIEKRKKGDIEMSEKYAGLNKISIPFFTKGHEVVEPEEMEKQRKSQTKAGG